jgi:hypothetical protein
VAMPRYSFVTVALESGKHLAGFLWVGLVTWWNAQVPTLTTQTCASPYDRGGPRPLAAFPELRRLSVHEPWLANPNVRVQCMWEHVGFAGARYKYFILSNGQRRTLGILLCEHELAYMRLHANYAFAAVDGTLWAGELRDHPVRRVFNVGGIDRTMQRTWSVSVVQRQRRCELQVTTGGLLPWTRDFRTLDDATICAEHWLTDIQHREAEQARTEPARAEWVM